jgi:hypothetical protein
MVEKTAEFSQAGKHIYMSRRILLYAIGHHTLLKVPFHLHDDG